MAERHAPRRIVIRPLPKIVFLYPTWILAIVCAVWAQVAGVPYVPQRAGDPAPAAVASENPGTGSAVEGSAVESSATSASASEVAHIVKAPPRWLGNTFMVVFLLNLIIFSFDFPRTRGLVILFGGVALLLFLVHFEIIGPLADLVRKMQPFADVQFYTALALFMAVVAGCVAFHTRFNYFEIEGNSIIHYTGFLGKSRRYPTPNLRRQMEITDVFEFLLLRSGKYVFYPAQEQEALILEVVPNILKKDKELQAMMGAVKMDAVEDDVASDQPTV
ncbi:MAG: hypothetical protein IPN34_07250 [Planctomycetes bacterium]|nr:hypothetical protein [Planctomycetota bacterium]